MKKIRVSLAYHWARILAFKDLAAAVRDGIYSDPMVFPMPTIMSPAYLVLLNDYTTKREAYKEGGKAQKGPYQTARAALMVALDSLAEYVDTVADGDENIILLSGFVPTKQTSSEAPVPGQATGVKITRESTGVFLTECDNQPYGTYYGCILTAGQPLPAGIHISEKGQIRFLDQNQEPSNGGTAAPSLMLFGGGILDINAKRKKRFVGLTLGVIYYAVYYVGNAQGVGGLSDPVSLHCS